MESGSNQSSISRCEQMIIPKRFHLLNIGLIGLLLTLAIVTGCTIPEQRKTGIEQGSTHDPILQSPPLKEPQPPSKELPPMPPGFFQESKQCSIDTDCIAVSAGCCTCRTGGKQRAIPASQSAMYHQQLDLNCKGILCPQYISNDPICKKNSRCQGGWCVLA